MADPKGYVYFAAPNCPEITAIKIGWSKNPWSAVHEGGNRWTWFGLQILAVIEVPLGQLSGTKVESLEAQIHRALRRDQIAREWFKPTHDLGALVAAARSGITAKEASIWAKDVARQAA